MCMCEETLLIHSRLGRKSSKDKTSQQLLAAIPEEQTRAFSLLYRDADISRFFGNFEFQ